MNKSVVETVKTATGIIGGIGVATIVGNAIRHVSPTNKVGLVMRVCIGIGSTLLGGVVCDATNRYAERKIDEFVEVLQSDTESEDDSKEEATE